MYFRRLPATMVSVLAASTLLTALTAEQIQADDDTSYERSEATVEVPDVTLLNQDRVPIRLREILSQDKVVMVDFVFTTCTTICPILSLGFANLQTQLGKKVDEVQLVSISIDPENDTPEKMKEYLGRFGAEPGWDYLTGSRTDIDAVRKAFGAFTPDKMSHHPIKLLKVPKSDLWVKIEGFPTGKALMNEWRQLDEQR